jgi:hypothetical protein
MTDSLISLRLPAVVWLASTGLLIVNHDTGFTPTVVDAVAWLVFLGGVAYFFSRLLDTVPSDSRR